MRGARAAEPAEPASRVRVQGPYYYTPGRQWADIRDVDGYVFRFVQSPRGIEDSDILAVPRRLAKRLTEVRRDGLGNVQRSAPLWRELTPDEIKAVAGKAKALRLPDGDYETEEV